MSDYTFGDVLRYNGLSRNELKRWTQAGLIRPALVAGDNPRRFSARNLVEAAVCDELRGLEMSESLVAYVLKNLNALWDYPDAPINISDPTGAKNRDATILWIALEHYDEPIGTAKAIYPVTPQNLISRLTDGDVDGSGVAESGIALPIGRLIADLEQRTGDRFDFTRQPVGLPSSAPVNADEAITVLAMKFSHALAAAIAAATDKQPISDEKKAAIVAAVAAALQTEKQP